VKNADFIGVAWDYRTAVFHDLKARFTMLKVVSFVRECGKVIHMGKLPMATGAAAFQW